MKYNNKNNKSNKNYKFVPSTKKCSCGKDVRERTRINYPYGKKSKKQVSRYYKCPACGKNLN